MEGARCRVPGVAEDCPSGQACGNDLRCGERAAACATAGTRCDVGTARCVGDAAKEGVERCSGAADPVCGAWVVEDCEAAELECGTRSGVAACECPAYAAPTFHADPAAGSVAGAVPFPTGALSPAACRFRGLGDALGAAAAAAAAGPAVVQVEGEGGLPIVFGDAATGETFPLAVAAKVTLAGAAGPAGPTVVRAEGASDGPLVTLQGALSRVRIESAPTLPAEGAPLGPTGVGVAASCGANGEAPSISHVEVDGGGSLTAGIDVAGGACGAAISYVDVSDVAGPALAVVSDPGVAVTVTGSSFEESAVGIRATGGKLILGSADVVEDGVEVSGNSGDGVVLVRGPTTTFDVAILGRRTGSGAFTTRIEDNGGTGIVVESIASQSKLEIDGCEVRANGGTVPRSYGPAGAIRTAGGLLLLPNDGVATFSFTRNRVFANGGDEIGVWSDGTWPLSPGACGEASNALGCAGPDAYAVSVLGYAVVDVRYNVWSSSQPDALVSGALWNPPCSASVASAPPAPVCPAP